MNTIITKLELIISKTTRGKTKNACIEIKEKLEGQLNLCDACKFHIATCDSSYILFGNGRGEDNIVKCTSYEYKS